MLDDEINLILDTDIGPDCDDAGALTLLHILAKKKKINFLAMTNCTSNPYAPGTIDAINRYYKRGDVPVGTFEKKDFLEDGIAQKYNKHITCNYENSFRPPQKAPDAFSVLVSALAAAPDASVTVVSIGPLNNLASLVNSPKGFTLVQHKVKLLVSMAGSYEPGNIEWNVEMDIPAAVAVFAKWPSPIVLSPMETGEPIITGKNFGNLKSDHPVRAAYTLWNDGDDTRGRSSWDLTAVWYAVMGAEPFFSLSEFCDLSVEDHGKIGRKNFAPGGRFRFLLNRMAPNEIAGQIDSMWSD